jgi:hypothetical protein
VAGSFSIFFLLVGGYTLYTEGPTPAFWGLAVIGNIWSAASYVARRK